MTTATVFTPETTNAEAPAAERAMIDERRRVYRDQFGFNTFRDPRTDAITMVAGSVSAVITPSSLGARVRALFGSGTVPVFSVGHRLWVFLAEGPTPMDNTAQLTADLFKCGAVPLVSGALIVLPTPGNDKRCWMHVPDGAARPPFAAVVEAVHTASTEVGSQ
ncbi:hypothetical protein ACQP1G_37655 [Nocardia sp. CA-107356]|uniref:hypothetical protein n=1 Tax=Nocardia sp. CA-107356 TaxID=3239972 RepID=UPI003D940436